jgi:DNA-binding IclR family transcriptional regulator
MSPAHSPESAAGRGRDFGIAISRAFEILRCFSISSPILGITDIVQRTGLPKATVSRITSTLEELGYLVRTPSVRKYRLGWGLLSLNYPLLARMPIRQVVRPAMHALATHAKANVNMATLDRLSVVFVESVRFDETHVTRPDIGASRPLLIGAIGPALVCGMGESARAALLNRLKVTDPQAYASGLPRLEKARRSIAQKGYCVASGEFAPGLYSIAAPMRVGPFEEFLSFNCVLSGPPLRKERIENDIAPRLLAMVRKLELQLGVG